MNLLARRSLQNLLLAVLFVSLTTALALSAFRCGVILLSEEPSSYLNGAELDSGWQLSIVENVFENILSIYIPVLAIMLTAFFSPEETYRSQLISRSQAIVAISFFSLIQFVNICIIFSFLFFSQLLDSTMPAGVITLFATITGVIVTFSFPEKKS